ncbi:MAG: hypothetical protein HYV96_21165 [Opitutae bacterium]|nr:hypothetical protein [Opitutae bacterium]
MKALIDTSWGTGLLVFFEVALVGGFIWLGKKTELLRDSDLKEPDFNKRPYSMAKSQLAFWITVIVGCFLYLYFKHEEFVGVINNTALILLGLSTATTALSGVVTNQKDSEKGKSPTPAADHPAPPPIHEDFLKDIMSDNEGMNVHRVQMFLWTLVFGIVFIHQVVKEGKFPEYDAQIFGLMGISSVTYVWFKKDEK